jgi:hypothetical protein
MPKKKSKPVKLGERLRNFGGSSSSPAGASLPKGISIQITEHDAHAGSEIQIFFNGLVTVLYDLKYLSCFLST